MSEDDYGFPLGTASSAAAQAYVEGVDRLLPANAGAEESFDRAIAADPGFALTHAGRARRGQLQSRAYLNAGRAKDAEALLRRRVERQPSLPIAPP